MAIEISKTTVVTVVSILMIAIGMYIGIRPRATDEAAAGEPAAAHPNVAEPSQEDSTTTIASTNNDPRPGDPDQEPDWKVYTNDGYGYEIKYPPEATIRDYLPNQILIEIGGEALSFSVAVIENPQRLSAQQWVEHLKAEWRRGADDVPIPVELISAERGPDEGPVQVGTLSGYRLRTFAYDHENDLVFFAAGPFIYALRFAAFDPNDPEFSLHHPIYLRILQTFRLLPEL